VLPAAQRVMEGYSTRWNDSNEVGMLTDDARDAMIEIDGLCRDYEGTAAVHAVADYFESIVRRSSPQLVNIDLPCTEAPTITPGTSDEVLHEYSVQWREAAESSNAFIEDDIEDWLVSLRDELHA